MSKLSGFLRSHFVSQSLQQRRHRILWSVLLPANGVLGPDVCRVPVENPGDHADDVGAYLVYSALGRLAQVFHRFLLVMGHQGYVAQPVDVPPAEELRVHLVIGVLPSTTVDGDRGTGLFARVLAPAEHDRDRAHEQALEEAAPGARLSGGLEAEGELAVLLQWSDEAILHVPPLAHVGIPVAQFQEPLSAAAPLPNEDPGAVPRQLGHEGHPLVHLLVRSRVEDGGIGYRKAFLLGRLHRHQRGRRPAVLIEANPGPLGTEVVQHRRNNHQMILPAVATPVLLLEHGSLHSHKMLLQPGMLHRLHAAQAKHLGQRQRHHEQRGGLRGLRRAVVQQVSQRQPRQTIRHGVVGDHTTGYHARVAHTS
eukprot:scaffold2069_cov254-Pinguiococcus_pyrenoidosus.AAC.30